MPENWDDPNRAPCLEIAEGYEKLADQLSRRSRLEYLTKRPNFGCTRSAAFAIVT